MSQKSNKKSKSGERTIEEKYQKLETHEHVLKKPGMYVGGIKKASDKMWVVNPNAKESDQKIILDIISYVPAFYKTVDEIITNARDRTVGKHKITCNKIKINVDKKEGRITIWNNGDGVDVVMHKVHKMYVPSLIFGEALSSTQYVDEDNSKRVTGGTNGLGAKLTNIYSTEFVVETLDATRNLKFKQVFKDNMYTKGKPKITEVKNKSPYTKISFVADFERFGIKGITSDMVNLIKKRAYDVAMNTTAKVYFNDELIEENNLQKYASLYFPNEKTHPRVFDTKSNANWKVGVIFDTTGKHENENISFVNGICTYKNGNHVDHVVNQIVKRLREIAEKKLGGSIKPSLIKENLIFFVDSVIVNPQFNSQTKEQLDKSVKEADFGSEYKLTETFVKALAKTGVIEAIVEKASGNISSLMSKIDGKKSNNVNVEKLSDAKNAGGRHSEKCGLFLTEGDSAKALALAGFNIIGRDNYGVYPLRGKIKKLCGEMKKKDMEKLVDNKEIKDIMKTLGLKTGKVYESIKELRYGYIVLMTDQDVDGYHIKGLLMNFINFFWPSLIKYEGFIRCFPTPIAKASKGKGDKEIVKSFYSIPVFNAWKEENKGGKGWNIKYYKGLGTSAPKEAREYFRDFEKNLLTYVAPEPNKSDTKSEKKKKKKEDTDVNTDSEKNYKKKFDDPTTEALSLAFDPKRADDRKIWMNNYDSNDYLDTTDKKITYHDFIDKELREHSVYNASRAIPNIMDGLKPSQRKILHTAMKKNLFSKEKELRVAQLAAATSELTSYHHGESSLQGAIIKLAQNFVGSNNINLLVPDGQFGTRSEGGDDAAAPRYIHTYLNELCKSIFNADDFNILNKQFDDGSEIEPEYYIPIIPMILVNGVVGIGTGYSSTILPCKVEYIVENIRRYIKGEKLKKMDPYFRHFDGKVEKISTGKYNIRGKYEVIGNDTIRITELPVRGKWIEEYKSYIQKIIDSSTDAIKSDAKSRKAPKGKAKGKNTKSGDKSANKSANKSTTKSAVSKGSKTVAKKKGGKTAKSKRNVKVSKANHIGRYIKSYSEECTDVKISIILEFYPGKLQELIASGKLEKDLCLSVPVSLTNMFLYDEKKKLRKYTSYTDILTYYADIRLKAYEDRKNFLLEKWKKDMEVLKWTVKFIEDVIAENIIFAKGGKSKTRDQVEKQLEDLKYPKLKHDEKSEPSYFYTEVGIYNLTKEKIDKFKADLDKKKNDYNTLKGKTPEDLWNEELDVFMLDYETWKDDAEKEFYENLNGERKTKKSTKSKKRGSKSSKD